MHAKTRFLLRLFIFLLTGNAFAQQEKVDSLKQVSALASEDSTRIRILIATSEAYLSFSAKKAIDPAAEARTIAVQIGDERLEANALLAMGKALAQTGNLDSAISCFDHSTALMRKVGSDDELGNLLINEGNVYNDAGSFDQALNASLEAFKIFDKSKNKKGMTRSLIVSGNVYRLLESYNDAVRDYTTALVLSRQQQDAKLEASCLNNLAIVYQDKGVYDSSLAYLRLAKKIHEQRKDNYELTKVLNNFGSTYWYMAMEADSLNMAYKTALFDTATQYYLASLEIGKQTGDRRAQVYTLYNIGAVSLMQGNAEKAIEYFNRALEISKDIKSLDLQMTIYESLHEAYVRLDDVDKALLYYKKYTEVKDSIYSNEMKDGIAEMQAKFGVEKAEAETRATNAQKNLVIWSSVIGGILFIVVIFFIWRQSTDRKRVNIALNAQKMEIEKKNEALNLANEEIELKNKDITDSIRYARRIQEAILPELEFATTFGKSGFVLYKPKDIVSGDFYWMAKKGDLLLFAAVDCTGHGVPGAFVSIVCSNLLTQAVNEHGFHEPNDILNDVNARLSVTLRQRLDESKVRDGMDIALCMLNSSTGMLHFAGAFNPAWIMRNGELIELKADKFPVGNFEDEALRKFVRQEMQLQRGDRLYVFSDGYSDQFGGPQGKKYKRVQFIELLKKIQSYAVHEHKGLLEREHLAWRGSLEQIDDIVVMGVEFPVNL